ATRRSVLPEQELQHGSDDCHRLVRIGHRPAHEAHQTVTEEEEAQRRHAVLDANDLMVRGKDVFLPESLLVMVRGMDRMARGGVSRGFHVRARLSVWLRTTYRVFA